MRAMIPHPVRSLRVGIVRCVCDEGALRRPGDVPETRRPASWRARRFVALSDPVPTPTRALVGAVAGALRQRPPAPRPPIFTPLPSLRPSSSRPLIFRRVRALLLRGSPPFRVPRSPFPYNPVPPCALILHDSFLILNS